MALSSFEEKEEQFREQVHAIASCGHYIKVLVSLCYEEVDRLINLKILDTWLKVDSLPVIGDSNRFFD